MPNRLVNIRYAPSNWQANPDYVYIGRAGKGQDGYFGNPFVLEKGMPRGATLQFYRSYLTKRLSEDAEFKRRVLELQGKTLVCFCAPKEGLDIHDGTDENYICHGQILVAMLDNLLKEVD